MTKKQTKTDINLFSDFLLCRRAAADTTTPGGIVLPTAEKPRHNRSLVIGAGPGNASGAAMQAKVGDTIVHRGEGEAFEFNGEKLFLVRDADVIGTV